MFIYIYIQFFTPPQTFCNSHWPNARGGITKKGGGGRITLKVTPPSHHRDHPFRTSALHRGDGGGSYQFPIVADMMGLQMFTIHDYPLTQKSSDKNMKQHFNAEIMEMYKIIFVQAYQKLSDKKIDNECKMDGPISVVSIWSRTQKVCTSKMQKKWWSDPANLARSNTFSLSKCLKYLNTI